jgi:DNA-binding MarR family transcriptional regulator/GNAT superfamily N-acetyltransferase
MNEQVRRVRSFNRAVTTRIGALSDRFLGRARPLGEARLLWEIGNDGAEVRTLRRRLDLDSGYTSRLLRSLEASGLITVGTGPSDGRVRVVKLTAKGRSERAELDARSDAFAASVLEPLSHGQRTRMVAAMEEIELLLTATLVTIETVAPTSKDAEHCLTRYFTEIDERFEKGFHVEHSLVPDAGEFSPPTGLFVVARLRDRPIGCGALKLRGTGPADIKRMWVEETTRGLGVGRRILTELEDQARRRGVRTVQLETNRTLHEAIGLYRRAGYVEVEAFNDEPYGDHWFRKDLG